MDYKALLEKYVRHVLDCEDLGLRGCAEKFTDEEAEALQEIQDKLDAEFPDQREKLKKLSEDFWRKAHGEKP